MEAVKLDDVFQSLVKWAVKGEINHRIDMTKEALALGRFKISNNCPRTIEAYKDAMWNADKQDKGIDERLDDTTTDIDTVDCTEYCLEPFEKELLE